MRKFVLMFVMASTLFVGCKKDDALSSNDKKVVAVDIGLLKVFSADKREVSDIKVSLFKTLEDAIKDRNAVASKVTNSEGYCDFEGLEERDYYVLAEGGDCISNIQDLVNNDGKKSKVRGKKGTKKEFKNKYFYEGVSRDFISVNKVGFVKIVNTLNENIEIEDLSGKKRFLKGESNGNFDETLYIVNTDYSSRTLYFSFYKAGESIQFGSESIPYSELSCINIKTINVVKPKVPVTKITYEAVTLQREQNFWLNSATHLGLNSQTRASIPIALPDNTVAFYYVVAVTESRTPISNIRLGIQLSSLLIDQTGTLGALASKVNLPSQSSGRVDVYLLDRENNNKFLAKERFSYYPTGTRESLSKGIIDVSNFGTISVEDLVKNNPNFSRNLYIGIRNPRSTTGENISIEVVAVVKKVTIVYE